MGEVVQLHWSPPVHPMQLREAFRQFVEAKGPKRFPADGSAKRQAFVAGKRLIEVVWSTPCRASSPFSPTGFYDRLVWIAYDDTCTMAWMDRGEVYAVTTTGRGVESASKATPTDTASLLDELMSAKPVRVA